MSDKKKVLTSVRPLNMAEQDSLQELLKYIDIVASQDVGSINLNFKFFERISKDIACWDYIAHEVKKKCESLGIDIPITHSSYLNSFVFDESQKKELKDKISKGVELSQFLGADTTVVHAGIAYKDDKYSASDTVRENVDFYADICADASKLGVQVGIENHVVANESTVGDRVEPGVDVLTQVCDGINERVGTKAMGICYDSGHANLAGKNIPQDIESIKDYLLTLHLHNNMGITGTDRVWSYDTHTPLHEGTIDMDKVIDTLRRVGFSEDLVIESVYKGEPSSIGKALKEDVVYLEENFSMPAHSIDSDN